MSASATQGFRKMSRLKRFIRTTTTAARAQQWRTDVPLSVGGLAGFPSNTMWPGPRPTSIPSGMLIHPAPSRLAITDMAKIGGCAPYLRELGPHLTQYGWAEAYLHTKWHLDTSSRLPTIDMALKWGRLCPFRC